MPKYSKALKDSLLARILSDEDINIREISRETGIHENTLRKWKTAEKKEGISSSSKNKIADKWSTQDKFTIVLEAATLSEIELFEYSRRKGLYPEQVKSWKDACLQANGDVAHEAKRLNSELRQKEAEYKNLEKELRRKEKALAETAALLVMRKNADAIWGDSEEE